MDQVEPSTHQAPAPARRRVVVRRRVVLLALAEALIVVGLLGALLATGRLDGVLGREVHLHGSRPPDGQHRPRLDRIVGIEPALPAPDALRGTPQLVVATCVSCRTGDVFGSLLESLDARGVPDGARVDVVVWRTPADLATEGRSLADFRALHLPSGAHLHVATTTAAATAVQHAMFVPTDGGFGYVYDGRGRWRSTYPIGLARIDDVLHDLTALR